MLQIFIPNFMRQEPGGRGSAQTTLLTVLLLSEGTVNTSDAGMGKGHILHLPHSSWPGTMSVTAGWWLGKPLGQADHFSPEDSAQALSTSLWQLNQIDRTLNHVTLGTKINGTDQTSENQTEGRISHPPPSLRSVSFNSAKAGRARAAGNTEKAILNWGVYHFGPPFPLFPGQAASASTTPSLISEEAGDEAALGRPDSSDPGFYRLLLAAELVRHFGEKEQKWEMEASDYSHKIHPTPKKRTELLQKLRADILRHFQTPGLRRLLPAV